MEVVYTLKAQKDIEYWKKSGKKKPDPREQRSCLQPCPDRDIISVEKSDPRENAHAVRYEIFKFY